ncbi:DNA alkylation repair protein [Chengkuizengella axinellae]|uniref:DNA alkylation repair protein n=1 Tax=Chengkuizengella axinellae TaxID=3064388 RepID=A0ABT9J2G6_9BACL|nr:DNA alkylation repair protein [Chengkuizengella sp. 2205SS18-9]MDP5275205.1 DNA alkylation repair protein [Chengkuizengella sp. 2205SS18-9]
MMSSSLNTYVINEVKIQLKGLSKESGLTTGKVRSVSARVFKQIQDKSIENVFTLCERLLGERKWEYGIIAYDWAFRVRDQYRNSTFIIFENWLKTYVTGWGDCDDFCTHAFGDLLSRYNCLFPKVLRWTDHPDFWVRRASAIILIYPIKKMKYHELKPFAIADRLMNDDHHLVLKGYGWMLKILSASQPEEVYHYLIKNKELMPRISFRYAIEKLDNNLKLSLKI